jgi:flagellar biosynthesis component FlhA
MNEDMPWVNLTQEEVEELRKQKHELTEYAREKLRKLIYEQDMKKMEEAAKDLVLNNLTHEEMLEEAAKREAANELYQDALHELDNLAAGDVDSDDFMNAYLVIQTALKVALGEGDV